MDWLSPQNVAEYSPDMPDYNNPGSSNIINCLPRTPQSYGPMSNIAAFGVAIDARCQGAFSCQDSSGNNYVFSGNNHKQYLTTSASTTPSNVTNAYNSYSTSPDGYWKYVQFGQRVITTNYDDPIQSYILGTSTVFSDLANGNVLTLTIAVGGTTYTNGTNYALSATGGGGSGFTGLVDVVGGIFVNARISNPGRGYTSNPTIVLPAGAGSGSGTASITATISSIAPKAKFADVAKGFLITANTTTTADGNQTQRVWWSGLNDPTNWPTPGTANAAIYQSSYNDLFGDYGQVTGIVGNLGGCDAAVFMDYGVWRMVYSGSAAVFDFFPAEGTRGTHSPNSIVHLGPYVYYLGEDGFYVFDGTSSKTIGANRVDKTFFSIFDQNYPERVWGAADPINKIVFWLFPSTSAINGVPDTLIVYNWQIDRWSLVTGITAETIFRALTFGYTFDTLPGRFNDYTATFDSRQWTGGNAILAGFNSSHQLSYFNGGNLAATIETSESNPSGENLTYISNTRALVDGGTPSVSIAVRNRLIDMPVYGNAVAINSVGTSPLRANGRYVRGQMTMPAGAVWKNFQGISIYAEANGEM